VSEIEVNGNAGQVLVQVAIMVGVLFGFLALALDGGHFYVERRRMQNAADAGALAGAHELCFGDPDQAEAAALDYAINRNDAQWANVDVQDNFTVSVVAGETMDTFFAGLIGIDTADVSAEAAAVCAEVVEVCGLWPIALDHTLLYTAGCGDQMLIWEKEEADCDTYSCTCYYGQGVGQAALPNLEARTWVDFSAIMWDESNDPCDSGGCGSDELKDRIHGETFYKNPGKSETCQSWLEIPSCTPGDSGAREAVVKAAEEHISEVVWIPIYDPAKSPCPIDPDQLSDDPSAGCGDPANTKYITDVLCVQITGVCKLCLKGEDPKKKCNGPSVIQAEVLCEDPRCAAGCGATGGSPPEPGDLRAVSLVK
jgi:hypothetical protein